MVLLVPVFLYYFGYNYYLIVTEKFWKNNDAGPIYLAIKKSKKKTNKKKIIISDSVGAQLFPIDKKYDSIYTLSTTAPSSLVGSYILLQNLSEYNSLEGATVYYVVHPSSLDEELRGEYTYNHFVKPFYTLENKKHISTLADSLLHTISFVYASQLPFVKTSNWQPEFNFKKDYEYEISNLYIEYFHKMIELAAKEKFEFKVVSPFLRKDKQKLKHDKIKTQIKEEGFDKIFYGYFKNMKYLPLDYFSSHSNHYSKDCPSLNLKNI
tara:strand:+ start:279 stop:1076 length:798 start_codon:yes stop_codon:yes gene_type:complete